MKLSNKVKNALTRFIDKERAEHEENDGYHRIDITEPEFGHIVIDIKELGTEVKHIEETV